MQQLAEEVCDFGNDKIMGTCWRIASPICIHHTIRALISGAHSLQVIQLPPDAQHFYPALQWPHVFDTQSRVVATKCFDLTAPGVLPAAQSSSVGTMLIRRGGGAHNSIDANIMAGLAPSDEFTRLNPSNTVFINRMSSNSRQSSIDF